MKAAHLSLGRHTLQLGAEVVPQRQQARQALIDVTVPQLDALRIASQHLFQNSRMVKAGIDVEDGGEHPVEFEWNIF